MQELETKIIDRIKSAGPIRFRDFMEMALYDPEYGYYCSPGEKIGRCGDYYTSANINQAFGALLAGQIAEMRYDLGSPRPFTVVEVGAGTGQLASDILLALRKEQGIPEGQIEYIICESSPAMQARQAERLSAGAVRWAEL